MAVEGSLFLIGVVLTIANLIYSFLCFVDKEKKSGEKHGFLHGRNGIEQLGDSLAELHRQTSEVSKRADFIASKKRSALEQRLMNEYEAAVDVFEKRERTAFNAKLEKMENDHKNRIASITTQHIEALVKKDKEYNARIENLCNKHEQELKDQEEELTTHFAVVLAKVAVDSGNAKQEPLSPQVEQEFSKYVDLLLKYTSEAEAEEERQGKVALDAANTLEPQSLKLVHAQAAFTLKFNKDSIGAMRLMREYETSTISCQDRDMYGAIANILDCMGREDDATFHLGLSHPSHLDRNEVSFHKAFINKQGGDDPEICFDTGVVDLDLVSVAEGLTALGEELVQSSQFKEAIKALETVVILTPYCYAAHMGLSWCYLNVDKPLRAIDHAHFALTIDRTDGALRLLARGYEAAGDVEAASKYKELAYLENSKTLSLIAESKKKLKEAIELED